mgnify:CR=1 FL=1
MISPVVTVKEWEKSMNMSSKIETGAGYTGSLNYSLEESRMRERIISELIRAGVSSDLVLSRTKEFIDYIMQPLKVTKS